MRKIISPGWQHKRSLSAIHSLAFVIRFQTSAIAESPDVDELKHSFRV